MPAIRYFLLPGLVFFFAGTMLANNNPLPKHIQSIIGQQLSAVNTADVDCPCQEFTRTIDREFGTTADGMTALYNKYGKVTVKTWQNNSVKLKISIVVNAKDQREAERTFDRVKVNFLSTPGYVKAETMIGAINEWFPDRCGYSVNYEIWMPIANQLDLKNNYGNSWVSTMKGKLIAEIINGELRTEAIYNNADLNINNGKVWIARVNNVTGQLNYSTLNITEANELQIDSKHSDIRVEKGNKLRLTSKYDDFTFGKVDELRLQTKYANLKLDNARSAFITAQYANVDIATVHQTLDADISNGSLDVITLARNFNDANIRAKYTPVVIGVENGANFNFDAEANNADVHYPHNVTVKSRSDTGEFESVKGYYGDPNTKSSVKVRLNYGDVIIK
ncbi:MAG: DUF4097 family beta strand repeat protein [Saprospiraceae bacterium]|nr:DUF4097 family beta strand repeat protein [Saprospiraceae bacterium]